MSDVKSKDLKYFWALAIGIRFLAALTHSHWFHPDEWYQTLEPANLIAHGFGLHSQEIGLHLRNLTWPFVLAELLKFDQWLSPNSVWLRLFSIQLLCGFLDLTILWGWIQLLKTSELVKNAPVSIKKWSLALLLLLWFTVYPAVSARGEHLSEVALWFALGCMARRYWFLAGVAGVSIFAFRYPSILLTAGLSIGIIVQSLKLKNYRVFLHFTLGSLAGLLIFGLADAWIYGRPWESFWMYLQYNLFTGSSYLTFGQQGVSAYLEFFTWHWGKYSIYIPLGLLLLTGAVYGFFRGILKLETWALCLPLYILGHLWVDHKESRFMVPIETLLRWAGFVGLFLLWQRYGRRFNLTIQEQLSAQGYKRLKTTLKWAFGLFLLINSLILLHEIRSDLWKPRGTLRELGDHLSNPEAAPVCAILSPYVASSLLIPFEKSDTKGPILTPPTGWLKMTEERPTYKDFKAGTIHWIENAPQCRSEDQVLLHVPAAQNEWLQEGCTLLASGALKVLPEQFWPWAVEKHLAHGSWYRCPPTVFTHFQSGKILHLMSHSFGKIAELPPIGITPIDLEDLGHETSKPPKDSAYPSVLR